MENKKGPSHSGLIIWHSLHPIVQLKEPLIKSFMAETDF